MNALVITRIVKSLGVAWSMSFSPVAVGQVYFPVGTPRFQTVVHVEKTRNGDGTHSLSVSNSSKGNQIALSVLGGATFVAVAGQGLLIERANAVSFRAELLPSSGWRVSQGGSRLIRHSDLPPIARWSSSTQNGNTVDFVVNFRESQPQGLTVVGGYFEKIEDNPAGTVTEVVFIGAHVVLADLDVDSRNTGSVTFDSESDKIEHPEIGGEKPGKILVFQTRADTDGDGVEDFRQFSPCGAQTFVGMTLFLDGLPTGSKMRFLYSGSDPEKIVKKTVNGTDVYEPAPGHLRVWNVNSDRPRNPVSFNSYGNYMTPNVAFSIDDLRERARNGPDLPGNGHFIFYVEPITLSSQLADQTVTAQVQLPGAANEWITVDTVAFTVTQINIAADTDRDGKIDFVRDRKAAATTPFRYWINDDDDQGAASGDDIPERAVNRADYANGAVDSVRDLVDLFPVAIDIKHLLSILPSSASLKFKLKQADDALNFVYSKLAVEQALDFHKKILMTGFGPDLKQAAGVAPSRQITATGIELDQKSAKAFFDNIKDGNGGVVLVEGRAATDDPLDLVVELDGAEIARVSLNLKISRVEDMFRHVDLTGVAKNYNGSASTPPEAIVATRTGDPGEPQPDALANEKYFVFVHGYNVAGQKARGWNCEVFKRMHVLGSKARFVGVTWHGATGLDYHKAVYQAFQTGDELNAALNFTGGADVTIAAHSLGNMVVSHAIQSGGYSPSRYYMINAAVALEAYDPTSVTDTQIAVMTEDSWKNRPSVFFAANWHARFEDTPTDPRNELAWRERFPNVQSKVYQFYSPGDDVVQNPTSSSSNVIWDMFINWDASRGAWGHQEFVKGTNLLSSGGGSLAFIRRQAGWNRNFLAYPSLPDANDPAVLEQLKTTPLFERFLEDDLISSVRN